MINETGNDENKKGIVWNENQMTTGFPAIDEQHKEWISKFNNFKNAILEETREENWTEALLFFIRYTETHFRDEEKLMDEIHCSARGLNRNEHKKFQDRIQEITYMTWPLGATLEDVINLEAELADWLKNHICNIDVELRSYAKGS